MMVILAYMAFGLYFCIIVGGAAVAVFSASLVRAMVGLIGTLLGVAGMYLLMQSPFLAFMQLLIYVGAVCVIVFFALMVSNAHGSGDEAAPAPLSKFARSLIAGVLPVGVLVPVVLLYPVDSRLQPEVTPLAQLGRGLLEQYVIPFELISVILLVAMIGGVFLARDRRNK